MQDPFIFNLESMDDNDGMKCWNESQ